MRFWYYAFGGNAPGFCRLLPIVGSFCPMAGATEQYKVARVVIASIFEADGMIKFPNFARSDFAFAVCTLTSPLQK